MTRFSNNKKNFRDAIKRKTLVLALTNIEEENKKQQQELLLKSLYCLSAINQLNTYFNKSEMESYFSRILIAATAALNNPSQNNKEALIASVELLKLALERNKKSNYFFSGLNIGKSIIFDHFALMAVGFGGAILLGFCVLALGPWGATALGVGCIVAGLIVAAAATHEIYTEIRFCRGSQLKEIDSFVEAVKDGIPSLINAADIDHAEEIVDGIDLHSANSANI